MPAPPVGARRLEVRSGDRTFTLTVLYPANDSATPTDVAFGPYTMTVAINANAKAGVHAAALISHGNGGSPFTHRGTAIALAQAGFVVLLPEHVGNSRTDGSLTGTVELLTARPQQLRDALAAVASDTMLASATDLTRLMLIGHSIGAYTVLAAAGGVPVNTRFDTPVMPSRRLNVATVNEAQSVCGLVLLAPAAGWFMPPGGLDGVTAPVLLMRGAEDQVTPAFHTNIVRDALGASHPLDEVVVPGAGHFSFQSPYPPMMVVPGFAPATDPPGFDRVSFHESMNQRIVGFALAQCRRSRM
jgi:predicted dienelactone hydrolase